LNFFWPRLVPGGIVVCDDYGFTTCPGARSAMDEFFAELGVGIIELTTGQALAIKPGAAAAPA
jgi:O-methyltransferase